MRFELITNHPAFPNTDEDTRWYWDTARPLSGETEPYVAVQVYRDKDPNAFTPVTGMRLLFTDHAEYYAVCPDCHSVYRHLQWSGSTRNRNWREESEAYLSEHQQTKGWCEFCDPVLGHGGWRLD